MNIRLQSFLIVFLLVSYGACTLGIDLAGAFQTSTFQCLKNGGFQYAIVRAFHSYGSIDKTAIQSLTNARSAGLSTDIYMFPCRGKNATTQVDEMISGITSSLYGMVWIDVETNPSSGCSWAGHDATSNCQFLTEIINRVKSHNKQVGIYSSKYMWQQIFSSLAACSSVSATPLWYAHYDNSPSFSDFAAFGGWTKPAIKQFAGDLTVCGIDLDKNYKP
jgi:GH25 family lysozyme M1 (1,4-beta-N-acetylmuramidase)